MTLTKTTLLTFIKLAESEGFKSRIIPSASDEYTHYENIESFINDKDNDELNDGISILKLVTEESHTIWESVPLSSMRNFKNSLRIILDNQIYDKYFYIDLKYKYLIVDDKLKIISIEDDKVVGSFDVSLILELNHSIISDSNETESHFYVPLLNDEFIDISKVIKCPEFKL